MARLNNRQQRFVDEYMIDLNATQAAIRAGVPVKGARQQASRMLTNVDIARAIEKRKAEMSRRTGVSAERVLRELARIGFVDTMNVIDNDGSLKDDCSPDDRAAVRSIRVRTYPDGSSEKEVMLHDKLKALETLGKFTGINIDRKDITTNGKEIQPGNSAQVLVVPAVLEEDAWEKLATEDDNGEG